MEALVLRNSDFEETIEHIAQLESKNVTMEIKQSVSAAQLKHLSSVFQDLHSCQVERLILFHDSIDGRKADALSTLIRLPSFASLIDLNLTSTSLSPDSLSLLFSALSDNDVKLRYLELDSNPTLEGDLSPLASFPSPLQSLSELCLDADCITSSSLHTLLTLLETNTLSQMTSLHLRGNPIPRKSSIENELHDADVKLLLPSLDTYCPVLQTLGLSYNPITQNGLEWMKSFFQKGSMASLSELQILISDFQGTPKMRELQQAFCQGLQPLDKNMAAFCTFFRHGAEVDEDDLSDFLEDDDEDSHSTTIVL
ncbi:hypothetical protein WA556_000601 [Blastocystis sp. ATCC 50177/Nand II]